MAILTLQPDATTGKDTILFQQYPNNNAGLATSIQTDATAAAVIKSLIQFNLSSIPAGVTITSAILTLICNTGEVTSRAVNIHRAQTDWYEGDSSFGTTIVNGSTWNNRNHIGSVPWGVSSTPGGQSTYDYASAVAATQNVANPGTYTWDLTSEVVAFYTVTAINRGWWLIQPVGALRGFHSSDNPTAGNRPKLVITYIDPNLISSTITATSTTIANIKGVVSIETILSGTSLLEGNLLTNEYIHASLTSQGSVVATLRARGNVDSLLTGTSTVVGNIQGEFNLTVSLVGISTVSADIKGKYRMRTLMTGIATLIASPSFEGQMRVSISGSGFLTGVMWGKAVGIARVIGCNPVPLLYLTDGSVKSNGQLNIVNFLSDNFGYRLKGWRPAIAQYKEGGRFSSSVLSQGRRLTYRSFDNAIEVFDLSAVGKDQDSLIQYQQELIAFQEAAADYWITEWASQPFYIVARAARETNTRYAIIHMISVTELENPYAQPFFDHKQAAIESLTVRLERGHWTATPPGQFECVPISSSRSWTVSGWQTGS